MSLEYNDLLGRPFHQNVRKELEARRSISQNYENSPTLRNPYFKLMRIKSLSKDGEFEVDNRATDLKFWELTKYSKQGLNDIKDKKNTNYRAPIGVTDVNIEIKDYTFHEVTVEFLVPDVSDWEAFKNTWLIFGAPIQYEFGKESIVEIDNDEDIRPDREIREGLIANFSWQKGESDRTITGSLTIYSSTFIELSSKAHGSEKESDKITSFITDRLKEVYHAPNDIDNEDIKALYGDDGITAPDVNAVISNNLDNDILRRLFYRTNDFYTVMTKKQYILEMQKTKYKNNQEDPYFLRSNSPLMPSKSFFVDESEIDIEFKKVPFGVDIVNIDSFELITEIQNIDIDEPEPDDSLSDNEINYIQGGAPFILNDGTRAESFYEWHLERSTNDEAPILTQQATNYGREYVQWFRNSYTTKRVLSDEYNFLSSTTLQKYILTQLNLSNDPNSVFDDEGYFYVSMKFIQDMVNDYLSEKYDSDKEDLISKYIFEDVRIRDLSFLGFGSSQPDRIIVNPWKKRYSKNDREIDIDIMPDSTIIDNYTLTAKNRYWKYDPNGTITLLEDIFISAPTVVEIAEISNSVLEFVENIFNSIEDATDNLLKFQKIGDEKISLSKHYNKSIRFYEISTIGQFSSENQEDYHTFDLFNPEEKLRNINVQSSLDDDFSQYAYFKSLGRLTEDENTFLMSDVYYKESGDVDHKKTAQFNSESRSNLDMELLAGADSSDDIQFIDGTPTRYSKELREGRRIVESYQSLFSNNIKKVQDRIVKYYEDGEIENEGERISLNLLAYIQTYFTVLADTYQMIYDPLIKSNGTITIPLKVDISIDGIAGIVTGNAFRIDLSSFPMAYSNTETSPLFVVSTLGHTITSSNDWETTIGGFLFISSGNQYEAIVESDKLRNLIDNRNGRLRAILLQLERNINEILSESD